MNLVLDLGQSGSRVKIGDHITSLAIAKNSFEAVLVTVEKIFKEIPPQSFESAYLSLTGLQGNVGDPEPFGELCKKYFQTKEVCVMDDGIASYMGALGDSNGVVLTLGGGVVAIASCEGRFSHADGKGPIFGDFGGGFWIGQSALRKAISTSDGRDNEIGLVELLATELRQYKSLENTTGVEASQLCISTAKTVAVGAEKGEKGALKILEEGATRLAETISAAWSKVKTGDELIPRLAIQGGLSRSKTYVDAILSNLERSMKFEYVEALGDHLMGAPLVAQKYKNDVSPLMKWWRA